MAAPTASYSHLKKEKLERSMAQELRALQLDVQFPSLRGMRIYFSGIFRYDVHTRPYIMRALGATEATSFTKSQVDVLVIGEKYGKAKIPKATRWDIPVFEDHLFWKREDVQAAIERALG